MLGSAAASESFCYVRTIRLLRYIGSEVLLRRDGIASGRSGAFDKIIYLSVYLCWISQHLGKVINWHLIAILGVKVSCLRACLLHL